MRQIEGTTEHALICRWCGGLNLENKEKCEAGHCDSVNDSYHNEICKACGGVIKAEPHQYICTNEITSDGVLIHKGPVLLVKIKWKVAVSLIMVVIPVIFVVPNIKNIYGCPIQVVVCIAVQYATIYPRTMMAHVMYVGINHSL